MWFPDRLLLCSLLVHCAGWALSPTRSDSLRPIYGRRLHTNQLCETT